MQMNGILPSRSVLPYLAPSHPLIHRQPPIYACQDEKGTETCPRVTTAWREQSINVAIAMGDTSPFLLHLFLVMEEAAVVEHHPCNPISTPQGFQARRTYSAHKASSPHLLLLLLRIRPSCERGRRRANGWGGG